jgi:hypothetical protein
MGEKYLIFPKLMKKLNFVQFLTIILMSVGGIGLVGGSFYLNRSLSKNNEASLIFKDTSEYKKILSKTWSNKTEIKHFPSEIPRDATNTRFVYSSGYKQGGNFLQLRIKQPLTKIKKLQFQYQNIAKYKYQGGNTNDHINLTNGVPTTFFYTSGEDLAQDFPSSYQILVLGVEDRGREGFKWNHGSSYGVAIDDSAAEIVYWAESW